MAEAKSVDIDRILRTTREAIALEGLDEASAARERRFYHIRDQAEENRTCELIPVDALIRIGRGLEQPYGIVAAHIRECAECHTVVHAAFCANVRQAPS